METRVEKYKDLRDSIKKEADEFRNNVLSYIEHCEKIEKALDRACEELSARSINFTSDEWKADLLDEVKE